MSARVELYREDLWVPAPPSLVGSGNVTATVVSTFAHKVPGKWRWRFVSSNGRILADSGQGYVRRIDALSGCAVVLGGQLRGPDYNRCVVHRYQFGRLEDIPVRDLTKAKP